MVRLMLGIVSNEASSSLNDSTLEEANFGIDARGQIRLTTYKNASNGVKKNTSIVAYITCV